jgi:hypothetical protein
MPIELATKRNCGEGLIRYKARSTFGVKGNGTHVSVEERTACTKA